VSDLETPVEDAAEQETPAESGRPPEELIRPIPVEAPDADAAEQLRGLRDDEEDTAPVSHGVDVDPAEAYDEDRRVPLDEEEYR
jgi:hypothetical protein